MRKRTFWFVVLLMALVPTDHLWALSVDGLRVMSLVNPQCVDEPIPDFSWRLQSDGRGVMQTAYKLTVTTDADGNEVVWTSDWVQSDQSVRVLAKGISLQPSTSYHWHVAVRDNQGNEAVSTETATFATGLMGTGWGGAVWLKAVNSDENAGVTDYVVEGKVRIERIAAGLCFAMQDNGNFYYWQLNTEGSVPRLRPHIWQGGNPSCLADVDLSGKIALNNTDEFTLRIEVSDANTARAYINGILVDQRQGNFKFGRVGMREDHGERDSREEIGVYDDIKVSKANGEVLFSEDFSEGNSFTGGTVVDGKLRIVGSTQSHVLVWQNPTEGDAPLFRKEFVLDKPIVKARLYTTALGVYDVFVNGERVGHRQTDGTMLYEELKPGWTDFRYRVFYSGHDVTDQLHQGANAMGAVVTSGWWAGGVMHGKYGTPSLGFMAKLVVTYDDGSTQEVVTDLSWASSKRGALRMGDIYDGETYDARLATDWSKAGADVSDWKGVVVNNEFKGTVEAFKGGYVQVLKDHLLQPRHLNIYEGSQSTGTDFGMVNTVNEQDGFAPFTLKKGQTAIVDFGQNMVGWVAFTVKGQAGNQLRLRCSEMLNDTGASSRGNDGPGGSLYLTNLRSAKATLTYTLKGSAEGESYRPSTTFFGFRYLEITATNDIEVLALEGQPVSSSVVETGDIETSNELVNQLVSNIQWGQRGNLLSIPTDCPQRDERLGWTADTQVFSTTGMYNAETYSFYRKWMQDMRDGQNGDGAYPGVAPECWGTPFGQVGWADAGILVPWNLYLMYGDKEVLRENYDSMVRYMDFLATQEFDGYKYNGGGLTWGDWLSFVTTDTRYIAVAYYALDAQLMAKMSRALSEQAGDRYDQNAQHYEELYQNIKAEFRSRYITPTIRQNTQTAYLMALDYNLLEGDDEIEKFKDRLATMIRRNRYKLNTGFLGTAIINTTLSRFGLNDYAYDLLLQRDCPSWLYSIDQGATTVWERWNSYTKESGFGDPGMNSFNHYAYGAIGQWMYSYMAGISADEAQPGFRHVLLQPQPDRRETLPEGQSLVSQVSAHYNSNYGCIRSGWRLDVNGDMVYDCTVPANTTATLRLPVIGENAEVREGGELASEAEGVTSVGFDNGCRVYELGSGTYQFTTAVASAVHRLHSDQDMNSTGCIYDLTGRAIHPQAPGIYVTEGRKIVMK